MNDRDRFDRFTEPARRVLVLAQEEAQRFQHNYIGTEHLLLGLVSEGEGVAAKVLANLGVELTKVRSAVEYIIGRGEHAVLGEIGLTPRARKVIELAVDEAIRLKHNYIGTEHILLGLIREGEGIAAGILDSLGVTLENARTQTMKVLDLDYETLSQPEQQEPVQHASPSEPQENSQREQFIPRLRRFVRALFWGRQSAGPNAKTYAAFISYNRGLDYKLVTALRSALHRFAKPWYQLRAIRIFRDDASLSANPGLWPSIQTALDNSEFFILLASPEAASSEWVKKEVDYWLANNPPDKFLIVVTSGEIVWNADTGDFDWNKTTALPRLLAGKFSEEPRYIDLRWVHKDHPEEHLEEHLTLADSNFRDNIADLAAPLHHRAKDELVGEDVRQHRRTLRVIYTVITALTLLSLLASTAAVVAIQQRQAALLQLSIATSRQLAADADLQASGNPQLAALLSVAAFETKDTPEARTSLVHQLDRFQHIDRFLSGSSGPISNVVFSRDGRVLVSGGSNVTFWDVAKGTPLATFPGSVGGQIALSPDGTMLAVTGSEKGILWDVARHTQLAAFPGNSGPIAFSPDGHTLALGGVNYKVVLWDTVKHTQIVSLPLPMGSGDYALAFSPDGSILAIQGPVGSDIVLWDTVHQTKIADLQGGHTRGVFSLAFSPDGKILASGGHDARVVLWDVVQHKQLAGFDATGDVYGLAFSPDGKILASADGGKNVILWDVAGQKQLTTFIGHTAEVNSLAFSPDGHILASGGNDANVILWNLAGKDKLFLGSLPNNAFLAFSPTGKILTLDTHDGNMVLWDIARRTQLATLPNTLGHIVAFSPDGRTLATTDGGKNIILWDVAGHKQLTTLIGNITGITRVVFSPDGHTLAATADHDTKIILWDIIRNEQLPTLFAPGPNSSIISLAFSPDGKTLASRSVSGITLWDIATGHAEPPMLPGSNDPGGAHSLAFSPDGHTLAFTSLGSANTALGCTGCVVILWDLTRHTEIAELSGHRYIPRSVDFSPDGHTLASADRDKVILWSVDQGIQMTSLAEPTDLAVFSPDGHTLATAGENSVNLWMVDTASWLHTLCDAAGRNLTRQEWAFYLPSDRPYQPICSS